MKLLHGDQAELFKDIEDNSIDMILTDPPYGVLKGHKIETIFSFQNFLNNCYRVLKKDGWLIYTTQEPIACEWAYLSKKIFNYKMQLVWNKTIPTTIMLPINKVHELVYIFTKGNPVFNRINMPNGNIATKKEKRDSKVLSDVKLYVKKYPNKTLKEILELVKTISPDAKKNDEIHNHTDTTYNKLYYNLKQLTDLPYLPQSIISIFS